MISSIVIKILEEFDKDSVFNRATISPWYYMKVLTISPVASCMILTVHVVKGRQYSAHIR
jgi:hypothetical protein